MDSKLKAAIAARNARNATSIDPLKISIRVMVIADNETYYMDICQGMIQSNHREAFRKGEQVPFSPLADGTERWVKMV